jgi:hypothetical protein
VTAWVNKKRAAAKLSRQPCNVRQLEKISSGRGVEDGEALFVPGPDELRFWFWEVPFYGRGRSELEGAMAMAGRVRLDDIDRSIFWKSADYSS